MKKELKEKYDLIKNHPYRSFYKQEDKKSYIRHLFDLCDKFYTTLKPRININILNWYLHEVNSSILVFEYFNRSETMIEYFLNVVHKYLDTDVFDRYWILNRDSQLVDLLGSHIRYKIENNESYFDYDDKTLSKVIVVLENIGTKKCSYIADKIKRQINYEKTLEN